MSAGLELFLIFLAAILSGNVIVTLAKGNTLLIALVAVFCLLLAISGLVVRIGASA